MSYLQFIKKKQFISNWIFPAFTQAILSSRIIWSKYEGKNVEPHLRIGSTLSIAIVSQTTRIERVLPGTLAPEF